MDHIPVYEIPLPEYQVSAEPDHEAIGAKADPYIKEHFLNQHVAIRALSSAEHEGKTADEVIEIIRKTGTDRYDPQRKGDRYENVEGKHIDFFALPFRVTEDSEIFSQFTHPFYHWGNKIDGYPGRIDILIVYDLAELTEVAHTYEGRTDVKKDGFVFRNPEKKAEAVKAIFKIS